MSLTVTTTGKEEWEEILKGSASYNMYNIFNVEAKLEEKKEKKKETGTVSQTDLGTGSQTAKKDEKPEEKKEHDPCKVFKDKGEKYKDEAYNLCLRLGPSLKYLHDVVVGGTRRYSCIHYKYWMSYKLLNLFKKVFENKPDQYVLDEFSKIQKIFVEQNNDHGCKYDYTKVNLEYLQDMDEKKYLHDYFRSYNTVKEYICRKPDKKEMYKEYLKHISELYKKYKEECSDDFIYWATNCPLYFKRGDEYDPKELHATLERPCLNNDGVQHNQGKEVPVNSPKKKKMTFYYLKCKNELKKGDYRRCALIPSTIEYTENKDKSKIKDEEKEEEIPVSPDPTIVLGGILKNRKQITVPKAVSGTSGRPNNSAIGSNASRSDQYNSQYLTEADGISPYLVQTEKGIKWRIHDKETLDCKNYGSEDPYGLCKHLYDLHQKGDFKLNPNPNFRKARSRMSSLEGEDSFPDDGLYEMEDDDTYPSDTGNDMFSLLKTKQFRTGTTIALMLGTFFLGFAYYKYTPLGSFFRRKKGGRANIDHEYFERKSEELSRRSQQSVSKSRKKERIQIAYQQA
ncbi:PIR protein [Plasmodium vivax]|nr:PIR protein [Plasmodium vivax]